VTIASEQERSPDTADASADDDDNHLAYFTNARTAPHSTQKPPNSQNKTDSLCWFRELCVDRRG
jgi:hypothetical protein